MTKPVLASVPEPPSVIFDRGRFEIPLDLDSAVSFLTNLITAFANAITFGVFDWGQNHLDQEATFADAVPKVPSKMTAAGANALRHRLFVTSPDIPNDYVDAKAGMYRPGFEPASANAVTLRVVRDVLRDPGLPLGNRLAFAIDHVPKPASFDLKTDPESANLAAEIIRLYYDAAYDIPSEASYAAYHLRFTALGYPIDATAASSAAERQALMIEQTKLWLPSITQGKSGSAALPHPVYWTASLGIGERGHAVRIPENAELEQAGRELHAQVRAMIGDPNPDASPFDLTAILQGQSLSKLEQSPFA